MLIFTAVLYDNPGSVVMLVHSLRYWQLMHDNKMLSLVDFASAWPLGYPTADAQEKAWDAQKSPTAKLGNYLDDVVAVQPQQEKQHGEH